MPEHICPYSQDIGAMKRTLDKIDITINGNGSNVGLKIQVDRNKRTLDDMQEDLRKIATAMSGLAKARDEELIIEREKEKNKKARLTTIQKIGTIAAVVFGALGALKLILDYIS